MKVNINIKVNLERSIDINILNIFMKEFIFAFLTQ